GHARLARTSGERTLRAPAPARVERQLERARLALVSRARLHGVLPRDDAERAAPRERSRADDPSLGEPGREERRVGGLVPHSRARAAPEAGVGAAILRGEHPRRARTTQREPAPPSRREPPGGERAARERSLDAPAQRIVAVPERAARAAAAKAHPLG